MGRRQKLFSCYQLTNTLFEKTVLLYKKRAFSTYSLRLRPPESHLIRFSKLKKKTNIEKFLTIFVRIQGLFSLIKQLSSLKALRT